MAIPTQLMLFQITQLIYWMGLATWFGSALFIVLAGPIIFKTVRESNPVLTDILSVNMDGQHGTLLAGSIVGNLIQRLFELELICGGAVLLALILHPFVISMVGNNNQTFALLRTLLFIGSAAVVFYDWQVLWPKIRSNRAEFLAHADEPEIANPAKDRFDIAQRKSLTLLTLLIALLLGMILFSSTISPPTVPMQASDKTSK